MFEKSVDKHEFKKLLLAGHGWPVVIRLPTCNRLLKHTLDFQLSGGQHQTWSNCESGGDAAATCPLKQQPVGRKKEEEQRICRYLSARPWPPLFSRRLPANCKCAMSIGGG